MCVGLGNQIGRPARSGKESKIGIVRPVVLDKVGITIALHRLSRSRHERAGNLYRKLMSSWGHHPDRNRVTVKLGEPDFECLESLHLPVGVVGRDVLVSGWLIKYRHPQKPELEVIVQSTEKPRAKRKVFVIGGKRRRLEVVEVKRITRRKSNKEASRMPRTKKKPVVEEDELEELEGLEELDELDDEDLEEDEPEDEEEDEEDEEDEPVPPKRSRAKAKPAAKAKAATKSTKAAPKATTRKRKAAVEDVEEEDEDEAPAPRKSRASAKEKTAAAASKGAASTKAKAKSNGGNLPAARELPKGQVGPREIAEMVGGDCGDRYVRIFLRENYERPEGGRWAFGKGEARTIAKEIKAARRAHGED